MSLVFRKILVPTDFSETAETALYYARELARQFGAELHLLHVAEDPMLLAGWTPMAANPAPEVGAEAAALREELKDLFSPEERAQLKTGVHVIAGELTGVGDFALCGRGRVRTDRHGYPRPRRGCARTPRERGGEGREIGALSGAHDSAFGASEGGDGPAPGDSGDGGHRKGARFHENDDLLDNLPAFDEPAYRGVFCRHPPVAGRTPAGSQGISVSPGRRSRRRVGDVCRTGPAGAGSCRPSWGARRRSFGRRCCCTRRPGVHRGVLRLPLRRSGGRPIAAAEAEAVAGTASGGRRRLGGDGRALDIKSTARAPAAGRAGRGARTTSMGRHGYAADRISDRMETAFDRTRHPGVPAIHVGIDRNTEGRHGQPWQPHSELRSICATASS